MTGPKVQRLLEWVREYLLSPRFDSAIVLTATAVSMLSFSIQRLIGWPGYLAMLIGLVVLAGVSLVVRRGELDWYGLLPISLLTFLGWAAASIVWSDYTWAALGGIAYLLAFTVLGLFIALTRDTIQIVRAFGDVLRVVLVASLAIEVFAGLLIDSGIGFRAIEGNLDQGGPIQGLVGTRNQLGLLGVVAAITFATEFRTKSVQRGLAIGSLAVAGATIVLAASPIVAGVVLVVAFAAASLYVLRRVVPRWRTFWQLALLGVVAVGGGVAWLMRSLIITVLSAGGQLDYRLELWGRVWDLIQLKSIVGWGWAGLWRTDTFPFVVLANPNGSLPNSASSAFVDVWFQLGLVGLVLFCGLVAVTFVRSWLLAGRRRSIVFAWPALVLVALVVVSLAESSILVHWGWLTFVVCCVKAARELSWRKAFERPLEPATD